jgi:hypothetical protein
MIAGRVLPYAYLIASLHLVVILSKLARLESMPCSKLAQSNSTPFRSFTFQVRLTQSYTKSLTPQSSWS